MFIATVVSRNSSRQARTEEQVSNENHSAYQETRTSSNFSTSFQAVATCRAWNRITFTFYTCLSARIPIRIRSNIQDFREGLDLAPTIWNSVIKTEQISFSFKSCFLWGVPSFMSPFPHTLYILWRLAQIGIAVDNGVLFPNFRSISDWSNLGSFLIMSDWQESGRKLNIAVELLNITQKEIRRIFWRGFCAYQSCRWMRGLLDSFGLLTFQQQTFVTRSKIWHRTRYGSALK
jgi:hypothetical protein